METDNAPKNLTWDRNAAFKFAIQLLALGLLLFACYLIFRPFITPIVWGIILAITIAPLHSVISKKLGERKGLASTLITLTMFVLILVPAVWLLLASAGEIRELGQSYRAGELHIPPPEEKVKDWPLIGSSLYANWTAASENLTGLMQKYQEQVKSILIGFLGILAGTARGLLLFALAMVAAGILLAYREQAEKVAMGLAFKLVGSQGQSMAETAKLTVRSVVKGIIGVAFIQSVFVGVGLITAGVPFAGIWIVICLMLSIVQIGILPVAIGVIVYIWSTGSTLMAVFLTIWMVVASVVDNILKPLLLGKGAPVPMLVVFIGSIGGFLNSGIVGLFTGAVLLSLGYKLAENWLREPE